MEHWLEREIAQCVHDGLRRPATAVDELTLKIDVSVKAIVFSGVGCVLRRGLTQTGATMRENFH